VKVMTSSLVAMVLSAEKSTVITDGWFTVMNDSRVMTWELLPLPTTRRTL